MKEKDIKNKKSTKRSTEVINEWIDSKFNPFNPIEQNIGNGS